MASRSRHSEFQNSLTQLAKDAGGSHGTKATRILTAKSFARWCRDNNVQLRDASGIKPKHIAGFIGERKASGISLRTLQNEASHLRRLLAAAGKEQAAKNEAISSRSLGIADAPRRGTKEPLSGEKLQHALSVLEGKDRGVAACLRLEESLGLRRQEAVMSVESLKSWERQLAAGKPAHVIFGTKGGRERYVMPPDKERALAAVRKALEVSKQQGGRLVDKPDLKSALNRVSNTMRSAGLTGKDAPHAARYAFANEVYDKAIKDGYSKQEALAMASVALGHGPGRTEIAANVYVQKALAA